MELALLVLVGAIFLYFVMRPIGNELRSREQKRDRAEAVDNANQILEETFNGDLIVTYDVSEASLPYAILMKAAPLHGYKYMSENKQEQITTVVFERVS